MGVEETRSFDSAKLVLVVATIIGGGDLRTIIRNQSLVGQYLGRCRDMLSHWIDEVR